jgi:hypothetical protein
LSRWAARTDLLFHRAGDVWLFVDPVTDQVHRLNTSAFWLWYHCDGDATPAQLSLWLSEDAGIPAEQAVGDVARGLEELCQKNLLVEPDG